MVLAQQVWCGVPQGLSNPGSKGHNSWEPFGWIGLDPPFKRHPSSMGSVVGVPKWTVHSNRR